MSVDELCEGIHSTRNYRRYLNGEFNVSAKTLSAYLERLKVQIQDFISYIYADIEAKEIEKYYFIDRVAKNHLYDTEPLYQYVIDHRTNFETEYNLLNISLVKYNYLLGRITKSAYVEQVERALDLDYLVNAKIITREEVEILHMLIDVCNEECKQKLFSVFYNVVYNQDVKILSYNYHYTYIRIITGFIKLILENPSLIDKPEYHLGDLINKALADLKVVQDDFAYYGFLNVLLSYYAQAKEPEKYRKAVYYYMAYQFSRFSFTELKTDVIVNNPKNLTDYLRLLRDEEFQNSSIYAEMRVENGE